MEHSSQVQETAEQRAIAELIGGSDVLRQTASHLSADIVTVAEQIINVLRAGGKLLICGNGGSAADSQHFAAELVGRQVDVIVANVAPAIRAAQQATATIPIVFATLADAEALGVVASLAQPGGISRGLLACPSS